MQISAKRHQALYEALNDPIMELRIKLRMENRYATDSELASLVTQQHTLLISALDLKRGKLKAN